MTPEELAVARARADAAPDDVDLQMQAAYGCDRWGTEEDAVVYYDRAYRLRERISADALPNFLVGYGSTLRNVKRLDESRALLESAVAEFPGNRTLRSFLALSLLDLRRPDEAVAALIDVILSFADAAPEIARYARALAYYRDELRARG
jgi:tetratricopeptide (TPR) repeat protein